MTDQSAVGHVVRVNFHGSGLIEGILVEFVDADPSENAEAQVFFPFDNSLRTVSNSVISYVGRLIEINPDLDECSYKEVCPHRTLDTHSCG
jgi:hypothetical protein